MAILNSGSWKTIHCGGCELIMSPLRQIAHERESPFSWHTRNCITPSEAEQRLSLDRWRNREYRKDKLRPYSIKTVNQTISASQSGSVPQRRDPFTPLRWSRNYGPVIKSELSNGQSTNGHVELTTHPISSWIPLWFSPVSRTFISGQRDDLRGYHLSSTSFPIPTLFGKARWPQYLSSCFVRDIKQCTKPA